MLGCKDIWVYAEIDQGKIIEPTYELLAKSHDLKKKKGDDALVTALLMGDGIKDQAQELFKGGAERVVVVDHPNLKDYSPRPYAKVMVDLCKKYNPSILMLTATANGMDLAPRAMAQLGTGLTADCIDVDINEEGVFVQTKPSYGGDILSHIAILEARPQMVTVRAHSFEAMPKDESASGEVIIEDIDVEADPAYKVLSRVGCEKSGTDIADAEVLVCIGRGVTDQSELETFEELAKLLGGELAVSRPLVDVNWMPHEKQIGQSGTVVKPKFLLNVAVSGSAQYTTGMDKSKTVLSINYNDAAAIFDYSHHGVVSDYKPIIQALIKELKNRQ